MKGYPYAIMPGDGHAQIFSFITLSVQEYKVGGAYGAFG
jgi:hypothetical protein